jgi:alkanesulfonate monooxygenase SsuD/methylene tetrahydromethanopterin reductase-like flavin-dependent oxidoreductase (luciferase family)
MKLSYFGPPATPVDRTVNEAIEWNLQMARWAEEFGFDEFWLGEHLTDKWEPIGAVDLVIAQALRETSRIKIGPGGYVLPYYHPAVLAHRIAQLDHMSGGRLQFGIAAGSIPTDMQLLNIDMAAGQHREMADEALDIILKIWSATDAFRYEGKYWTINCPPPLNPGDHGHMGIHLKPLQSPHPPIAVTGFTEFSGTLKMGARRGFIPMSLNMSPAYAHTHWTAIEQGAREGGLVAQRSDWRVLREVLVADTDKEARARVKHGPMGHWATTYFLPQFKDLGMLRLLKRDQEMADDDVTLDYLIENNWLVGSPDTVAEKLQGMYEEVGGFGHLMFYSFDFSSRPEWWRESLGLFREQVHPKVADLVPDRASA